jgi:hypothetical protein
MKPTFKERLQNTLMRGALALVAAVMLTTTAGYLLTTNVGIQALTWAQNFTIGPDAIISGKLYSQARIAPPVATTTITSIGAGSSDFHGSFIPSSTGFVLTFSSAWPEVPYCILTSEHNSTGLSYDVSTTAITGNSGFTAQRVNYICIGWH